MCLGAGMLAWSFQIMSSIKRMAVLTSGGDAPGMNAAVRAVVRTGIEAGVEVFGVHHGYRGLAAGDIDSAGARDVGGIMQRGGTMLGSARLPEFRTWRCGAARCSNSPTAASAAWSSSAATARRPERKTLSDMGLPVVGVASTIDNDLYGSDVTIGVDTALNVALEAIDRLKVTASSHHRAFVVEVMGRDCGYLALMAGIAGGAEAICVPEIEADPEAVAGEIRGAYERGKPHALVVVAEGSQVQCQRPDGILREPEGPAGLRTARHHPRPHAARSRSNVRGPDAGDTTRRRGRRAPLARRARSGGGPYSRRHRHHPVRRSGGEEEAARSRADGVGASVGEVSAPRPRASPS